MEEVWKDVVGYEGLFSVSNFGNIRNEKTGRVLKLYKNKRGYCLVSLYHKRNNRKTYRVHRLVAEAFIPNPNNYPYINHKDENPSNNRVDNLEWCTPQYNATYGHAHEKHMKTILDKYGKYHLKKTVLQYTLDGVFVKEYDSITEASEESGIPMNNISACCRNVNTQAKGFIFVFKGDEERAMRGTLNRPYRRKEVNQFDLNGNFIRTWESASAAAKAVGVASTSIINCALGKRKSSRGFLWKYKNQY